MDKKDWENNLKQTKELLVRQKNSVEDLTFLVECYENKIKNIHLNNKEVKI